MKRNGASLEFISESLGHSDIRTTESYLASFENDTKREWLISFLIYKSDQNISDRKVHV
jgi:integrase/recombinase XerD